MLLTGRSRKHKLCLGRGEKQHQPPQSGSSLQNETDLRHQLRLQLICAQSGHREGFQIFLFLADLHFYLFNISMFS